MLTEHPVQRTLFSEQFESSELELNLDDMIGRGFNKTLSTRVGTHSQNAEHRKRENVQKF